MNIKISAASAPFTSNGTNAGYIQVADNTPFYPSAICNLASGGTTSVQIVITDVLPDGQSIGCRIVPISGSTGPSLGSGPNYGRSDVSAFLVSDTATIFQPTQDVQVEPSNSKRNLL